MNKIHQKVLQKNRVRLLQDLNVSDLILDSLVGEFIITDDESSKILAERGPKNQARAFLTLLPRKGTQAFSAFVAALNQADGSVHAELATILEADATKLGLPVGGRPAPDGRQPGYSQQVSNPEKESSCASGAMAVSSSSSSGASASSGDGWPVKVQTADEDVRMIEAEKVSGTEQTDYSRAYDMVNNPHGLALIINNKNFTCGMKARMGSDVDARQLKEAFEATGFTTHVTTNATGRQMRDNLYSLAIHDHSKYDAVMVAILSHGIDGKIYGTDGDLVLVSEITSFFRGDRAKTLVGKPKIFFLQACRGGSFDDGIEETDGPSDQTDEEREEQLFKKFLDSTPSSDETDGYLGTLPVEADMLLAYATVPGYVSWRNSEKGSWFIQALVKVIHEDAKEDHLMDMLTRVNDMVATEFQSKGRQKQMPAPVTHLRKKFFLRPPRKSGRFF